MIPYNPKLELVSSLIARPEIIPYLKRGDMLYVFSQSQYLWAGAYSGQVVEVFEARQYKLKIIVDDGKIITCNLILSNEILCSLYLDKETFSAALLRRKVETALDHPNRFDPDALPG